MKTRQGFVSNSSSSSFTIKRSDLTQDQVEAISDHVKSESFKKYIGDLAKWAKENKQPGGYYFGGDEWEIKVTDDAVSGRTIMDNFDMQEFLEEELKIDPSKIETWHSNG